MKTFIVSLAAASALIASMPAAASAAPWQPINQRQANLERRIDQGVRTGDLTRPEAARLRAQFNDLSRLEGQYRRSGGRLTPMERRDLDARFDRLSQRIYAQRHDRQDRVRHY
jgi:Spy/CpxP family protein refolding chaperone